MIPDFFIVGALKSGTTSLYEYVTQHPDVFLPEFKEPRFFDGPPGPQPLRPGHNPYGNPPVRDAEAYEALFADATPQQRIGEGTASYFHDDQAPGRIAQARPDARIVVMLREPVARAYSSYQHLRRDGREPATDFREALAREPQRRAENWAPLFLYRHVGRYTTHLARWYDAFPAEQVQVHLFDDLRRDPRAVVRAVFEHLDVDPSAPVDVAATYNLGGVARSGRLHRLLNHPPPALRRVLRRLLPAGARRSAYLGLHRRNLRRAEPLSHDLRRDLAATFAPEVDALSSRLGRDLSSWLDGYAGHRP